MTKSANFIPILIFTILSLTACKNDSSTTEATIERAPVQYLIELNSNRNEAETSVVNKTVTNGQGNFSHPSDGETFQGNILVSIDASDPEGLAAVGLSFNQSSVVKYLCDNTDPCPAGNFHKTETNINPSEFGIYTGPLTIGLWILDKQNNQGLVDILRLDWQYRRITDVSLERSITGDSIKVSWPENDDFIRYNIFIAAQSGVNSATYSELSEGQAVFAITSNSYTFSNLTTDQGYFIQLSGVDGSGESGYSSEYRLAPPTGNPNTLPVVTEENFPHTEDDVLSGNILANDSDSENDQLTVSPLPIRHPRHGTVSLQLNGDFIYQPNANFFGTDSFIYEVQDGQGGIAQGLTTIEIANVNDAPTAVSDIYATPINTPLSVASPGLLSNDSDIDGDALIVSTSPIENVQFGSLVLNQDGSFTYTPNVNFIGNDYFIYQVLDPSSSTANARVNINVGSANQPPVAIDDQYSIAQNASLVADGRSILGVLANDSDPEGDAVQLSTTLADGVAHGTLTISTDGLFTYIPESNFSGTDSFSYVITDVHNNTAQATVRITIVGGNSAPVAIDDTGFSTNTSRGLFINAVINDTDVDDDPLSIISASASSGTVSIYNGMIYFDPAGTSAQETVQINYVVQDGQGGEDNGQITVDITNTWPIVAPDKYITRPETFISVGGINFSAPLSNDSDNDSNDTLSYTGIILAVANGSYFNGSYMPSSFDYLPNNNFTGIDGFFYQINDGAGNNGEGLASIEVTNIVWDNSFTQPTVPLIPLQDITFDGFDYVSQDNVKIIKSPFVGSGKYYAISNQSIISSSDGQSWQYEQAAATGNMVAIASGFTKNNPLVETHIAVGGFNTAVIHQQSSAEVQSHWLEITTGTNVAMTDIIFNGSQFIGVGMQCVMFSSDGYSWVTSAPNNAQVYRGVIQIDNLYVIVGDNGSIETSIDGVSWTVRNSGTSSALTAIAHNGTRFIAVGDNGTVLSSMDSISWSPEDSRTVKDLLDINWNGSQFTLVGKSGFIATSATGSTWRDSCCLALEDVTAITSDGSQLFATQGNKIYLGDSSDPDEPFNVISNPNQTQWRGIATNGAAIIVRVGLQNNQVTSTISTSTNGGTSWQSVSVSGYFNEVNYFNGLFLAVGDAGLLMTSNDGLNWTTQSTGVTTNLHDVFWFSGLDLFSSPFTLYVAVGANGTLITSINATSWQVEVSSPSTTKDLYAIDHDNDYFVAVGQDGTILVRNNTATPGGTTWMDFSNSSWETLNDIFYNGSTSHIVGNSGRHVVGTAMNGFTSSGSVASVNLNSIAGTTSNMIAVGDNGVTLYNATGSLWRSASQGSQSNLFDLHVDANIIHAVGADGSYIKGTDSF